LTRGLSPRKPREVVATTFYSTTHTQPIEFDRVAPGLIQITMHDGSTQVYHAADVKRACESESY
jgi:hypothetical protein